MSASDAVATIRDALERSGYDPRGTSHDFYARCPAHDGDGHNLHVSTGADGRAVVWCFAHECDVAAIVRALGLDERNLFPVGHRNARRQPLPTARRTDLAGSARKAANVLAALDDLAVDWTIRIDAACPYCGAPRSELVLGASGFGPHLFCENGCTPDEYAGALTGRLRDRQTTR
jgi:hypothetical protein